MNYRHLFHAGNFADVFKHALLVQLVRALQGKPAGLLLLDTHAGAGSYELAAAASGDRLPRAPEYPDGIGRLWGRRDLPAPLAEYLGLVRDCQDEPSELRRYPGSPWILRRLARPQDRVALFETEAEAFEALRDGFSGGRRLSLRRLDGYAALASLLPPPERRAFVLIDPPYEDPMERRSIRKALEAGLRRLPGGTYAVWYPLAPRSDLSAQTQPPPGDAPPPTLAMELEIDPGSAGMRGCGLLVLNPPWRFDREAAPWLETLAGILGRGPQPRTTLRWIVPES